MVPLRSLIMLLLLPRAVGSPGATPPSGLHSIAVGSAAAAAPPAAAPGLTAIPQEAVASAHTWIKDPLTLTIHGRESGGPIGESAGNHRAEVMVDAAAAAAPAVVARVEWRRRVAPSAAKTEVIAVYGSGDNASLLEQFAVLNASDDSALIAFAPTFGPGRYDFYYLGYSFRGGDGQYASVFSRPRAECLSSAAPTKWQSNRGTAEDNIVVLSSGGSCAGNAAWKAADGVLTFKAKSNPALCDEPPVCQGWNARGGGNQYLVFDMGSCVSVDGFALYSAGDGAHDPKTMRLEAGDEASALAAGQGKVILNFTGQANTTARQNWSFSPHSARFWKWSCSCRWSKIACPGFQSYLAEIEFKVSTATPEAGAGGAWRRANHLDGPAAEATAAAAKLPAAGPVNLTARTEWDRFSLMEVMATAEEVAQLRSVGGGKPLVFVTPRELAVRDFDGVPLAWARAGPTLTLTVAVECSEYVTWQVGVLNPVEIALGSKALGRSLLNVTGYSVKAAPAVSDRVTCFNLGGNGYDGLPFRQPMSVERVGSLWFGYQVPDKPESETTLEITLHFDEPHPAIKVTVTLACKSPAGPALPAHGDRDPTRLARLRWLDSGKGLDFSPSKKYDPVGMKVDGSDDTEFTLTGRLLKLAEGGHFSSIQSNGIELLAAPIQLLVQDKIGDTPVALTASGKPRITRMGTGAVHWTVNSAGTGSLTGVRAELNATLTYDGYVDFSVNVSCATSRTLADIRLQVPMRAAAVKWLMGFNVMPSGKYVSPVRFNWAEYARNKRNSVWLGKPSAGLRLTFKGTEAAWNSPIEMPAEPPGSWANCKGNVMPSGMPLTSTAAAATCKGNASVVTIGSTVLLQSRTGAIALGAAGLPFKFDLLITPLRPVDLKQHFTTRYFHFGGEFPPPGLNLTLTEAVGQIAKLGATWVNIHQGSNLNPYINYPLRPDLMGNLSGFVSLCHAQNMNVKLYFTTRELTNRCSELFALKSLPNHEILFGGPGGGEQGRECRRLHYCALSTRARLTFLYSYFIL